MKKVTIDLFKEMKFISELNSFQQRPVFVLTQIKEEKYEKELVVKDKVYPEFSGGLWVGENELYFIGESEEIKNRKKAKEEISTLYSLDSKGEAHQLLTLPINVTKIVGLLDQQLIFLGQIQLDAPDYYKMDEEERKLVIKKRVDQEDYQIVSEQPYYQDGAGFTNGKRQRMFSVDLQSQEVKAISEATWQVSQAQIAQNRHSVFFKAVDFTTVRGNKEGLYEWNVLNHELICWIEPELFSISEMVYHQGDLWMACSNKEIYGATENPNWYCLDYEKKKVKLLYENKLSLGSAVGSDCTYGGNQSCVAYQEGIAYVQTLGYKDCVKILNEAGEESVLFKFDGSIQGISETKDGLYFVGMQRQKLQEVYFYHENEIVQCTHYNEALLQGCYVAKPEHFILPAGRFEMDCWICKPEGFDENKHYPAILDIHGGPKMAYGEVFFHEMQYWVSEGYVVFYCNPRGSEGKGNDFSDLRGKYGTIDYDDFMNLCDEVLRRVPQIDSKRIGVTGGSYGGFMCNWIIGHTNRFAAAASQRSIANWVSLIGYADIGFTFDMDQMDADPWHNIEKVWDQSPMKYADKATTPTLFIHSFEDYRCLLQEGMQMYNSLVHHGTEAKMILFKGESHGLSRIGKPAHRIERLHQITSWMDQYCK